MCLAVPGEVLDVSDEQGLRMATVDFGGTRRHICLDCTPEAGVGSYVLVHAGFAVSVLDEEAAAEVVRLLGEALPGEAQPGEAQPGEAQPGEAQPGEAQPGDGAG